MLFLGNNIYRSFMKKKLWNKKPFRGTLLMLLSVALFSCKEEGNKSGIVEHDPNRPVVLTSFMPLEGGVREKVLLNGENFGTDPTKIKVYFNHARAAVVSSSGDRLYALVPRLPGEICKVAVVVGEDSVIYDQTFTYHTTSNVSTITGNGSTEFRAGTLAQAQVYARYLCVDNEQNLFASVRDAGSYGVVRINEKENIVSPLIMNTSSSPLNPNAPAVDLTTGILTVPHDGAKEGFFNFDPKEGWAPRQRSMKFSPQDLSSIGVNWKYTMAFSAYDGCFYARYGDGWIVKMNATTYESELVYKTNEGAGYGLIFDPQRPYILYMTFHSNVTGYQNSICTLDIRDPSAPDAFKKISTPLTGAGHRDGPIETAQFNLPRQLAFDQDGNLFIADYGNHCIRMVSSDGVVQTVVGQPGVAGMQDGGRLEALFRNPWGLAVGLDGTVYISDYGNARIRKLTIE